MNTKHLITALMTLFSVCLGLSAQTETTYERGATYLENTLPPSPEPASVVKYADVPFTHSAGLAEYNVPFYTLQGNELSIPIGLHYASGGIKLDEIAGVAGLGWTLEAGGCITRTVMYMPDEFVPIAGSFHHEMPSGTLLDNLEAMAMADTTITLKYLKDVLGNRIDSSLDRYIYNVCGLSGSFVIKDNGNVFQLSGSGVRIAYTSADDGSIDTFTLTGPDGTVYTFSEKEIAEQKGHSPLSASPMSGQASEWSATTAWHITTMRSRSGLETAEFHYTAPMQWQSKVHSFKRSVSITCGGNSNIPSTGVSSRWMHKTHNVKVLSGITLNGQTATFTYSQGNGSSIRHSDEGQANYPFSLKGITVHTVGNPTEICRMDVGTGRDPYDGRIVLNSLLLYRSGILNDKWDFTYSGVGTTVSRGSQDWYGYYNGENEFSETGNHSTCPFEYRQLDGMVLTNGFPNSRYANYMSLKSINHNGAVTEFFYEGNSIKSVDGTYNVGIRVKRIVLPSDSLNPIRARCFRYESPYATGPYVPLHEFYTTVSMTPRPSGLAEFVDWTYTFHESPVALGPSIHDTKVFYGRVTEDVTDNIIFASGSFHLDSNTSRTVYTYATQGIAPTRYNKESRFPSKWRGHYDGIHTAPAFCSPWSGIRLHYNDDGPTEAPVLTRQEQYAYDSVDGYKLVSSADYVYERKTFGSILTDYHVEQVVNHWQTEGKVYHEDLFHYPIYTECAVDRYPVGEIHVGYHPSGNDTTVVTMSYHSRTLLTEPRRVSSTSITEGKIFRHVDYKYADDRRYYENWAQDLTDQRFLSVPVWKKVTYEDASAIETLSPLTRGDLLEKEVVQRPLEPVVTPYKEEVTEYDWFEINGQRYLLPSAHVEYNLGNESWREDVLSRDLKGNISSSKAKGSPQTVIIWGYGGHLPVAVIQNATYSQVESAIGGQPVIAGLASAGVPPATDLSKLNQLKTSLPEAHVTTYTHIPGVGVESITDPAGLVTTFEYEGGRLVCTRDNDGHKINEYEYHLLTDADGRKHIRSRTFRSADAQSFTEDVIWWDKYGRKTQNIAVKASLNNADLVTAYESDFMFHDDVKTWLPYPKHNTGGQFQTEAAGEAAEYHASEKAYIFKNYEMSVRDRVVSEALPGYAGEHETSYTTDIADELVHYRWENDAVSCLAPYAPDEIVVSKVTDADGRLTSTYTDHSGKTLATSNGEDAPTYYIYDLYDRLRAVASSGIAITDTLNMWRYDYDSLGRMSSKGVPGSVREYYTYDSEDRIVSILRDGVLKEMEYDAFGRVLKVWQTGPSAQRTLLEQHTYDVYPSGVTGSNPKGKKTQSRLAVIMPDGNTSGYTRMTWSYDDKGRPVVVRTSHADGSEQIEELEYTFAGDIASSVSTYIHGGQCDELAVDYTYDIRGRLTNESVTLTVNDHAPQVAEVTYGYDALGRRHRKGTSVPGGKTVYGLSQYALQGWQTDLKLILNGRLLFEQSLCYDEDNTLDNYVPQYGGMVSLKEEKWHPASGDPVPSQEWYQYDYAGRLGLELRPLSRTAYTYDARGNVQSVEELHSGQMVRYSYNGDMLDSLEVAKGLKVSLARFTYDNLGRMTYDGLTGQSMTYNDIDLLGNIEKDGSTLANYSYLSDGTKLSATDGSGKGLVYRGPFVYRKSSDDSSLTLESAAFSGGKMTPDGVLLHVTDYLGSIRAVVDGQTGELYKASGYSAFGDESEVGSMQTAPVPFGITLRDGYTGKENQNLDFSTNYTDFGARQYNPALRRWMTPDPLSEKYYGISPYAFCNNNPVNFVDLDGASWGKVVKVAKKAYKTFKAGNKLSVKGILKSEALDLADNVYTILDSDASVFEKGIAAFDLATGFGDEAKWLAKTVGVSDAIIDGTRVVDGIKFKSFTRNNFRDNLGRLTGGIPNGMQAHHTLPYAFEKRFSDIGINIHDPKYGVWLDSTQHSKLSQKYNKAWEQFFIDNPSYTAEQVMEYATKLMNDIFGQ